MSDINALEPEGSQPAGSGPSAEPGAPEPDAAGSGGTGPGGSEQTGSEQAWAKLADQFTVIAKQFRQHYERVSSSPRPEPDKAQGSVERAATVVGKAIEDTARAIDESVRDPQVRQDTTQAGSALLRAVGATLTDLGAALQREAATRGHAPHPEASQPAAAEPDAPAPTTAA